MIIEYLNLAAFGPFTERLLTFNTEHTGDGHGLHIVYGPNEAGKSSSLRGLKALLYGIDERTPDNFIHANNALRISGSLRNASGHTLAFTRRKGRKNTLLNLNNETLDPQSLSPFLSGVTANLFDALFGIDHAALLQGGQEILEQKGELGQALFSAALGRQTLHKVLEQLDTDAAALFLPNGSKQTINIALKHYKELKAQIKETALSSREWDEHHRALEKTNEALAQTESELAKQRHALNRLERIQRVLPKLTRRHELLSQKNALNNVTILPDDFTKRRQQIMGELDTAQALFNQDTQRQDSLLTQKNALVIDPAIIAQRETIQALYAHLPRYKQAQQEQPQQATEQQQLLLDIAQGFTDIHAQLPQTTQAELKAILAKKDALIALANQHTVLESQVKQKHVDYEDAANKRNKAHKNHQSLPALKSVNSLRQHFRVIQKKGDIDLEIHTLEQTLSQLKTACNTALARFTLWQGSWEELRNVSVPSDESIHHFETRFAALDKHTQRVNEKQEGIETELHGISQQLDVIQATGDVPTEQALIDARTTRNKLWQQLRKDREEQQQGHTITPNNTLAQHFENQLNNTDTLADRLRREAERVHALASAQAAKTQLEKQRADINAQSMSNAEEHTTLQQEWQALWLPSHIQARTPREMRTWLDTLMTLRIQGEKRDLQQQELQTLLDGREAQTHLLRQELAALNYTSPSGTLLEPLLLTCEQSLADHDAHIRERENLEKNLAACDDALATSSTAQQHALNDLNTWSNTWGTLTNSLGINTQTHPPEITALLIKIDSLIKQQNTSEKLAAQLKTSNEATRTFQKKVDACIANTAPELMPWALPDAVTQLHTLLSENNEKNTQHKHIEKNLRQIQQEIQTARTQIETMDGKLRSLCIEAQCLNTPPQAQVNSDTSTHWNHYTEFELKERQSHEYWDIKAAIDTIETEIIQTGEGASISALEKEVEGLDPHTLPAEITQCHHAINDTLEPKRLAIAQTKGREEKELELMDGNNTSAELAEQAQAVLTKIRSDTEAYVRSKLAGKILRDEIERYRQANQGPLIQQASHYFSQLTLKTFTGLLTDFNEKDEPTLKGLRANKEQVSVEGMSVGTRDQLYLALRLASLEKYMENTEAMPFIIDDVLVDFDDERSFSALNLLSSFAEKTQVIIFTHHLRIIEQAENLPIKARIHHLK